MAEKRDENDLEGTKERLLKGSEKYATRAGYKLNPDPELVDTIITGLANNKFKHSRAYCPCFFVSGNPEEDRKLICPCHYHKEDIEKTGKCHCGLFVKG
ncbi:MAG: ferredoxin:thioredoxin reductase [Candidatus Abyssobacteria bacterium SURF_5]|uniref:ferredoxin:thioredoxin reductase n=1 Tax=Abyssobacteria bacterium (strain SURF_5) TaxID=2093360 RepID=A0A3A4N5H5_ABYX5|nr:MAG: ferredoxin:thioredoxin reductase [Candidatus Abyssubacteria bacterium SURF_5]